MTKCIECNGTGMDLCSTKIAFPDYCSDCGGSGEVTQEVQDEQLKQKWYDEQDNPHKTD